MRSPTRCGPTRRRLGAAERRRRRRPRRLHRFLACRLSRPGRCPLARQIGEAAVSFGTRNPQALRSWIMALETKNATAVARNLEQAIAADPDFAPSYRLLAEQKSRDGDRDGARQILEAATEEGQTKAQLALACDGHDVDSYFCGRVRRLTRLDLLKTDGAGRYWLPDERE